MTDVNELRDMLHYPDDEYRLSADVIIQKARRRQRVKATAAAGVSLLAAGLTAWSVWPLVAPNRAVSPPAAESSVAPAPTTSALPQPSATAPATTSAPPVGLIGTAPVDLGRGWLVWTKGTKVCVQFPRDMAEGPHGQPLVDCRGTIDRGFLGVAASVDPREAFYYAPIPHDAARVVLTFTDGTARDARVFRLDGIPGWTFFTLYVSASDYPALRTWSPTEAGPSVTAYDAAGQVLGTLAAPPS
jgi:hypothetical protein